MNVMGFAADQRVERMVERVEQLSPRIPLRFGAIADRTTRVVAPRFLVTQSAFRYEWATLPTSS